MPCVWYHMLDSSSVNGPWAELALTDSLWLCQEKKRENLASFPSPSLLLVCVQITQGKERRRGGPFRGLVLELRDPDRNWNICSAVRGRRRWAHKEVFCFLTPTVGPFHTQWGFVNATRTYIRVRESVHACGSEGEGEYLLTFRHVCIVLYCVFVCIHASLIEGTCKHWIDRSMTVIQCVEINNQSTWII